MMLKFVFEFVFVFVFASLIVIAGAWLIFTHQQKQQQEELEELTIEIISSVEKGYMEGQKDVIEGDIRIAKVGEDWMWIKSPWDDTNRDCAHEYLSQY